MTEKEAKEDIAEAFRALTPKQRANLRYHARKRTKILCGKRASLFVAAGVG